MAHLWLHISSINFYRDIYKCRWCVCVAAVSEWITSATFSFKYTESHSCSSRPERADRQSVCMEGSLSVQLNLNDLVSASWHSPPGCSLRCGMVWNQACALSLIQTLSGSKERLWRRNIIQEEQQPTVRQDCNI